MFQLDESFLQELGLGDLPPDQKAAFLQHIYEELELRVGTKLSEGLTDAQMAEFESFIDRDHDKIAEWLGANLPTYRDDPEFQTMQSGMQQQGADETTVLGEYASLKWLEVNRPDYKQVVADELNKLKSEIISNRDSILGKAA